MASQYSIAMRNGDGDIRWLRIITILKFAAEIWQVGYLPSNAHPTSLPCATHTEESAGRRAGRQTPPANSCSGLSSISLKTRRDRFSEFLLRLAVNLLYLANCTFNRVREPARKPREIYEIRTTKIYGIRRRPAGLLGFEFFFGALEF